MELVVKISEKDVALIQKIEEYQKEENLSFEDAVKSLCGQALSSFVWEELK